MEFADVFIEKWTNLIIFETFRKGRSPVSREARERFLISRHVIGRSEKEAIPLAKIDVTV